MNDLFGGRLIEHLRGYAKLGLGFFDAARIDGGDDLFAFRADRLLGRTIFVAENEALLQSFSSALDIRHGYGLLGSLWLILLIFVRFGVGLICARCAMRLWILA
jgi:hypothetical protein